MTTSGPRIVRPTRPVSWIRAALKDFECFPEDVRLTCIDALTVAAEGGKAEIAKPMHGLGSGVFEIVLPYRGDAFRVIYALHLHVNIWVVHAFQKKSTIGIRTPKRVIELVRKRMQRLDEVL